MKLLQPANLDLHTLIKDDGIYSYLTNTSGRLGICFKNGKVIRKLIPEIQYFISVCICKDEAQGDFRVAGFKRIRIADVHHILSYKKMRQVIHFLTHQHIIEVKGIIKYIDVNGKQVGINAKHFRIIAPFDGDTKILEVNLKTKQKITINDKAEQLIESNPVIRHQYEMCSSYNFDAELAEIMANQLFNGNIKNDRQYVSMLDYIDRLKNQSVLFNYSQKTDRIFTIINMCHKELREYFKARNDNKSSGLIELDFSTFNIQILHKLIDDNVTISNINENLVRELDILAQWLDEDFYKKIQEISASTGTIISRDSAKDLALKYWQNARPDSWNEATKIMKTLFPEITKVMNELKGSTYENYLKYSNGFMRKESELVQEIYAAFISKFPEVTIYNIFDSFMIEEQHKDSLRTIMDDCSSRFFKRHVNVKEKVTY